MKPYRLDIIFLFWIEQKESEMLNLKSSEIHWIFHTVCEIGWILSPRVFAKPFSHHTGRLLQLWCQESCEIRIQKAVQSHPASPEKLLEGCSFQVMLHQFIKVLNLFEGVPLLMGLFILKDIKATSPTDVIFHPLRMKQVSISFLPFV